MDLKVLSAGAVQRGLEIAADAFERDTGHRLLLTFATAPVITSKVEDPEIAVDMVIAPLGLMSQLTKRHIIASDSSAVLGSVKAGVAVRQGDWQPDVSTAERLKEELIVCDTIAYTEGSSGIFAEELIQRLGIREVTREKTTRLPDASAVMKFLADTVNKRTIAFGQLTAILLHAAKGVKLVGPLPKEVENITTYAAGVATGAEAPEVAHQFLRFLVSPFARAAFRSIGVEPEASAGIQD